MPRQVRKDLSYFTLDCDIFSTKSNLKPLIDRYNADGLAVYIHILCDVYGTGYYLKPTNYEDYLYGLAKDIGISVEKVQLILAFMADRTLLDAFSLNKNTVFTSHGIQKRYAEAMKGRKRSIAEIKGEYWLLTEKEEAEIDTFYKSHLNENKSEKNDDKSEKNDDKSEICDTTEQNRTEMNNNTHRVGEGARTREEEFEAQFKAFCAEYQIQTDNYSSALAEIDFNKLQTAYAESKNFLQVTPCAKTLSWICRNYNSIIAGKYKDKPGRGTNGRQAERERGIEILKQLYEEEVKNGSS